MKIGPNGLRLHPTRTPQSQSARFPEARRRRLTAAGLALVTAVSITYYAPGKHAASLHQPSIGTSQTHRPVPSSTDVCAGEEVFQTLTGPMCTHGDDTQLESAAAAPDPLDTLIASATAALDTQTARTAIPCHGDGTSGNRIQFIYAYLAGHANRLQSVAGQLFDAVYRANGIVNESAKLSGGHRFLRVLTNSSCVPAVVSVSLTSTAESSFPNMVNYLQSKYHFTSHARKYVVFGDFNRYCGLGSIAKDDSRSSTNINNRGPSYARVDNNCWNGHTVAHEIFHMLGAVQLSAPHSDGTWHCTDTFDLMCYPAGGKPMVQRCFSTIDTQRADCGRNDYFNLAPAAGSYLATHWNSARNSFLYGGGPAYVAPPTPPTIVKGTLTSLTSAIVTWAHATGTISGYAVYRNGVLAYKGGTARNWTDTAAVRGQTTYRVKAYNATGYSNFSSQAVATLLKPGAPSNVAVTALSGKANQVTWTDASGVVFGYRVYGVLSSGSRTGVLSLTSWLATSAIDGTVHTWTKYQVCAYNDAGETCASTP